MKRCVIFVLVLLFAFNLPATSSEKVSQVWRDEAGNTHTYEEIGLMALEAVNMGWWPEEKWVVEFFPGKPGFLGMTFSRESKIKIWIRKEHSPTQVAKTLVHELAHVFVETNMTSRMRAEWLAIRGLQKNTLWSKDCGDHSDECSAHGDFAESVAYTLQDPSERFASKLGPPPNKTQQKLIRKWFFPKVETGKPLQ